MRKGKIHQATSITNQIRNIIITSNKLSLAHSKRGSKAVWSTVNKLSGKIHPANANTNIDADTFNSYFASISNSSNYIELTHKLSAPHNINYIASSTVYYILNKSCPKETGSDGLPDWFFKFISLAICEPLSTIIYLTSVITSLLTSNKFLRFIALDFSKAFDTLNHSTLITNMASLQLDDSIHNLLISFF